MPVIDVNLQDFLSLLQEEMTLQEIMLQLPMMGTSWEGATEDGFTIEIFPNRPDLLSIEGLARAFASFTGIKSGLMEYEAKTSGFSTIIEKKVETVRPFFASAVIKNIDFDDPLIRSIIQMQEKLHVTHGRKRRKVSIGLHDLDPIKFPVHYTTEPEDFIFRPLGERRKMTMREILEELPKGREYAWILDEKSEYPLLIDDKNMVLSMPPIINSEHTRIDEATEEIFVDVTSTDVKAMNEVLNIIVTTFADRGAQIYRVTNIYPEAKVETPDLSPREMLLETGYVNSLLGVDLTESQITDCLERMGYGVKEGPPFLILIPSYRTDVMHPIDLVEDVAIAYGYNNFTPQIPAIASPSGENPLEIFSRNLRNSLVGYGFQETMTFMMTNRNKLLKKMGLPEEPVAETENPKTEEYTILRNRLLPSLMEVLSGNTHYSYPQNLFEVDDVIVLDEEEDTGARTSRHLAVVLCHAKANFSELKSVMNSIFSSLGVESTIQAGGLQCFIEGRRIIAKVRDRSLCWAGEVKPQVLLNWGLEMPVSGLEMDVDSLFESIFSKEK